MSSSTMSSPRRASWRATSAPKPEAPPVIRAVLGTGSDDHGSAVGGQVTTVLGAVDEQPRDALAVLRGVAVRVLQPLGALEVEVRVVLPGEADAAVVLD